MSSSQNQVPDHTAVRVALWRAMHVQVDSKPHVLTDEVGLRLVAPDANWQQRPDMHPQGTRGYRAAIVARARFIEDLVFEESQKGITQYVILGAGLDTFAQRRPDIASKLTVFEIDKPDTQAWKKQRLAELGFSISENLKFVPVDFEAGDSWWEKLIHAGFNPRQPAILSSTGVAMYLSKETNMSTFRQISSTLAAGSVFALSFMLTVDLVDEAERAPYKMVQERAQAAGTPFLSLFHPSEIIDMAQKAKFKSVQHISRTDIIDRYFKNRSDGLTPASGEEILVART